VASQLVQHQPAAIAILEPQKNHEWRSGLAVNGLQLQDTASVQRAPLRSANVLIQQGVQLIIYTMENSSPFMGDPAPTVDTRPLHLQGDIYICGLRVVEGYGLHSIQG
jgi:hypothetical protein